MNGQKMPHIQFYTGDWIKDPGLKFVSLAAKGLWMDLLCHMNESYERGWLVNHKGEAYSREQIARLVGLPLEQIDPLLDELERWSIYSIDARGAIFSRRLVRDEKRRLQKEENGKHGGRPRKVYVQPSDEECPNGEAPVQQNNLTHNQKRTEQEPNSEPNSEPTSDNDIDIDNVIGLSFLNKPQSQTIEPLLVNRAGSEMWAELVAAGSRAEMSMDRSESSEACVKCWSRMDVASKMAAIEGIKERVECGQYSDPAYVPSLENYLRGRKWKESLRPKAKPAAIEMQTASRFDKTAYIRTRLAEIKAEKEKAS